MMLFWCNVRIEASKLLGCMQPMNGKGDMIVFQPQFRAPFSLEFQVLRVQEKLLLETFTQSELLYQLLKLFSFSPYVLELAN
jgi:hypothetical protein